MFRKLISNLPFNPSLVSQVSFYTKRVQQEASVRRMGFGLIAIAMFIQMFAIIAPPERSLAASDNNIINGLRTRNDILTAWDRAGSDIPDIYGKFGLTRADIEKLPLNPNTTIRSNSGQNWWTIGRNSLSGYSGVKDIYKRSEVALSTGPTTVYMRQLRAWDIRNPYNTYKAFAGTKADGTKFWILVDCGNYTQVGKYTPKVPQLDLRKTIVGGRTSFKPGDSFTFRFEYRNSAKDSLAENALIQDELDLTNYDIVSPANIALEGSVMRQPVGNLAYSPNYSILDVTVRLKNPYPNIRSQTCNVASLTAVNAAHDDGGPVCATVVTPCEYDITKPKDANCKPPVPLKKPCKYDSSLKEDDAACVEPKLLCSLVDTDLDKTTRVATFKTTVVTTNPNATKIISYKYDFGDKKTETATSSSLTHVTKHTYDSGTFTAKVVVTYSVNGLVSKTTKQIDCSAPIEFETDKPFGEMKKVKNITQNLEGDKVLNASVNAGDTLEYTLITSNTQDFDRKDHVVVDYVGDLLDYADIDMAFLSTQGGTFNATNKKISFKLAKVAANSEVAKSFRIKLKSPVPSTNTPSTVSGSFDCKITNKYGNELTMDVSCPAVKGLETLPNTGPGTSLLIGFTITTIVGYFFARARIIAKELTVLRAEYAPTGGF